MRESDLLVVMTCVFAIVVICLGFMIHWSTWPLAVRLLAPLLLTALGLGAVAAVYHIEGATFGLDNSDRRARDAQRHS